MKNLKTYEGFFDFFKNKEKVEVTYNDIIECLYDIIDESRIEKGNILGGIFASDDVIWGKSEVSNHKIGDFNFSGNKSAISFEMTYSPNSISDKVVDELLLDCKSKLEIYNCKMSFFIGWGVDEGSSSDKEWSDFITMINKTIVKTHFPNRPRNITIKIKLPK